MTKEEILQILKELKPKYEAEGFEILGLFGSYARDEATESSDVDITLQNTEYVRVSPKIRRLERNQPHS